MKQPIISCLSLLLMTAYVGSVCHDKYGFGIRCNFVKLEANKPVHLDFELFNDRTGKLNRVVTSDDVFPNVDIYQSEGSIGRETFSLMPEIMYLDIYESNITSVEDGVLCSLPDLKILQIYKNRNFPNLTSSMMSNCSSKLWKFTAGSMNMEPDALKNMVNLKELTLRSQNISHLTKEYLEPLKILELLEIIDCDIGQVDPGVICQSPRISELKIGGKALPSTNRSTFQNCDHIRKFTVNLNNKQTIEPHAFNGFKNAELGTITGANITHLKREHLAGLDNLGVLEITHCGIREIDPDTFTDLKKLRELTLSSNELAEFDTALIAPMPKLWYLDISKNILRRSDVVVRRPTTLTLLYAYQV